MYAEVAWVLVSSGTQIQPQIILDPDYFPDYPSISYDYVATNGLKITYILNSWVATTNFRHNGFSES